MAVELWPPISSEELKKTEDDDLKRELKWLVDELHEKMQTVRHGLEDCYALLAPIDPGSTLPLTTPGKELIKGVMTRVGTRISRGTIQVRLRTLPQQTLTVDPTHPIHIAPLLNLTKLLDQAIDMLSLTLSVPVNAHFLHAQLRILASLIAEASAIIKGPPVIPASRDWTYESLSPRHFSSPLGGNGASALSSSPSSSAASVFAAAGGILGGGSDKDHHHFGGSSASSPATCPPMSIHVGLRNGNIVLSLRALEPVDAPVGFGTRFALAIGTTRRLEHDEADRVFTFTLPPLEPHRPGSSASMNITSTDASSPAAATTHTAGTGPGGTGTLSPSSSWKRPPILSGSRRKQGASPANKSSSLASMDRKREVEVYVREKVEVETGDPSLLSVQIKLSSLEKTLALARKNLAIALGEDFESGEDLLQAGGSSTVVPVAA